MQKAYEAKAMGMYARREIRRRIAEALLDQAMARRCSHATCRAGFNRLTALDFSTAEIKAHYCLLYARSALRHGHKRTAYKIAKTSHRELSEWLTTHRSLLGNQLLGLTGVFLRKSLKAKAL